MKRIVLGFLVTAGIGLIFSCTSNSEPKKINSRKITQQDDGTISLGLDQADRDILKLIIEKFNGGPVGLSAISAATSEEQSTVEEVYEPFLLKIGMLERTHRGRMATKPAYDHLGYEFTKPIE